MSNMGFIALVAARITYALRVLLFPELAYKFAKLRIWKKITYITLKYDPLYFLTHRYYLSKKLSLRQRVECAISHHEFENTHYDNNYVSEVYRSDGITLWSFEHDENQYSIKLVAGNDNIYEGEIKILLYSGIDIIWKMAFCYASGNAFGSLDENCMLISRNQAGIRRKDDNFLKIFGQSQPQFLCLFAAAGIAKANNWTSLVAIRHDQQIAYVSSLESGFYNSYSNVWKQFGGEEVDGHVFKLSVPLPLTPIEQVPRSHRARAGTRRAYWDEISRCAEMNLRRYRI